MSRRKSIIGIVILLMLMVIFPNNVQAKTMSINKKQATVYVGKTCKLQIKGTSKKVKWSSSNTKVASVSSNGIVKGKKEGFATITANVAGKKYKCVVRVKVIKVSRIDISKKTTNILIGSKYKLIATVVPSNATYKKVIWKSANSKIATVDTNGGVKGISEGKTVISAISGKVVARCTVYVKKVESTGIFINKKNMDLIVGERQKLVATVIPSNATNKVVTWSSSNNSIATVDANGFVKGVSAGQVTVTVKTGNNVNKCIVTVMNPFTIQSEQIPSGILVYAKSNKKCVDAVDFEVKYFDNSGKRVYLNKLFESFYHVKKDRVCTFFVPNPKDISYASYIVEAKEFYTINYKLDLYDSVSVTDIYYKTDKGKNVLYYTFNNKSEEVVDNSRLLFLCYKNDELKEVIDQYETSINVYASREGKVYISDFYDKIVPIVSRAFVRY